MQVKLVVLLSALSSLFFSCSEFNPAEQNTRNQNGAADQTPDLTSNGAVSIPLTAEEQSKIRQIATTLGLSEDDIKLLEDLMTKNHAAIDPLSNLISTMDSRLVPYIKDKWIKQTEHLLILKAAMELKDGKIAEIEKELAMVKRNLSDAKDAAQTLEARIVELNDAKDTLIADKKKLQDDYNAKVAEVAGLKNDKNNLLAEISWRLGYTDEQGRLLASIGIVGNDSNDAIAKTALILNETTSLRAIATYAGSDTKRDVTVLASWAIGKDGDAGIAEQKISESPNLFFGRKLGSGSIAVSLGQALQAKTDEVQFEVRESISKSYGIALTNFKTGVSMDIGGSDGNAPIPAHIPAGIIGGWRLKVTYKDRNNSVITVSDVTDTGTFQINQEQSTGSANLVDSSILNKRGLFAGQTSGAVQFKMSAPGFPERTQMVNIAEAEHEYYYYVGIPLGGSPAEYMLSCPMPSPSEGGPGGYKTPNMRPIVFAGTVIHPGLHEFKSDCSSTNISSIATFRPESEPTDIIVTRKTPQGIEFIANRPTEDKVTLLASLNSKPGAPISTRNEWSIKVEHRTLTSFKLMSSSEYSYGESSCYAWNGNSTPTSVEAVASESNAQAYGAGTNINHSMIMDPTTSNTNEGIFTYLGIPFLRAGYSTEMNDQMGNPYGVVTSATGLIGFALDATDLTGVVTNDGKMVDRTSLGSDDIAIYLGTHSAEENQWTFASEPMAGITYTIVPGGAANGDRVVVTFPPDARPMNTFVKVVAKKSLKTGVLNPFTLYWGHRSPDSSLPHFAPAYENRDGFVYAPKTKTLKFFARVKWNDCLVEDLNVGSAGLPSELSGLQMLDTSEAATAHGSFGRRWEASTFTASAMRPAGELSLKAKINYDFSSYCHRPDKVSVPVWCSSLTGSFVSDSLVVPSPQIQGFSLKGLWTVACPTNSMQDSPSRNELIELKGTTQFSFLPLIDESYIDDYSGPRCLDSSAPVVS